MGKKLQKFLSGKILGATPRVLKYIQRDRKMGPRKKSGNWLKIHYK